MHTWVPLALTVWVHAPSTEAIDLIVAVAGLTPSLSHLLHIIILSSLQNLLSPSSYPIK